MITLLYSALTLFIVMLLLICVLVMMEIKERIDKR